MTIRIRLNDNTETWGTDGDQALATRAAEIMCARLEPLLAEEYPEATIDIDTQPTETPDTIQVFKADGDADAENIKGEIMDTLAALHADVLAEALAEQREPMEIQGRCYIPQVAIYQAQIATGAARREGRAPSHDGECVSVFWTLATNTGMRWIVENNAGVSYTSEDYDNADEDELAEVLEGIDEPGNQRLTGSGSEALDLMVLAGWLKPCDEPADE